MALKLAGRENDRVHHNKGKEHHEEKPPVAELRRLAIQPHSSGKKPGECIQAKKVKNVLRGQTQAKARLRSGHTIAVQSGRHLPVRRDSRNNKPVG